MINLHKYTVVQKDSSIVYATGYEVNKGMVTFRLLGELLCMFPMANIERIDYYGQYCINTNNKEYETFIDYEQKKIIYEMNGIEYD